MTPVEQIQKYIELGYVDLHADGSMEVTPQGVHLFDELSKPLMKRICQSHDPQVN